MAQQEYHFNIQRDVDGETIEYQLVSTFKISEENQLAYLENTVYTTDDDGSRIEWQGCLTEEEETEATIGAYQEWFENDSDPDGEEDFYMDFDYLEFDSFRDDRAVNLVNGGKVYY